MGKIKLVGHDLGAPALKGAVVADGARLTITAGGTDIWGSGDEGHFASAPVGGNFSLTARLVAMQMADPYSKAGIMLRAGPEAFAPHLMLVAFGDNRLRGKNDGGIEFQSRALPYGGCEAVYPQQPPTGAPEFPVAFPDVWLRLQRRDDYFEAFFSRDGLMWQRYCRHRTDFTAAPLLGLAVTSHNVAKSASATFAEIDLIPLE